MVLSMKSTVTVGDLSVWDKFHTFWWCGTCIAVGVMEITRDELEADDVQSLIPQAIDEHGKYCVEECSNPDISVMRYWVALGVDKLHGALLKRQAEGVSTRVQ